MSDEAPPTTGRGLWVGLALGAPFVVVGAVGLFTHGGLDRTLAVARWGGALLLVHDLLLVPLVLALVWLVGRASPPAYRAPLVAALLASGLVAALAAPGVLGLGNPSGNPTVHPFATGPATAVALLAVWATAGVWCAVSASARRRRRRSS